MNKTRNAMLGIVSALALAGAGFALYSCGGFAVSADRNEGAGSGIASARSADYQHLVKIHFFHPMGQWMEIVETSLNFIDVTEDSVTFTSSGNMREFPSDINSHGTGTGMEFPRDVIKGIEFCKNFADYSFTGNGVTAIIETPEGEKRYRYCKGLEVGKDGVLRCYYNKGGSRADFKKGEYGSFFINIELFYRK